MPKRFKAGQKETAADKLETAAANFTPAAGPVQEAVRQQPDPAQRALGHGEHAPPRLALADQGLARLQPRIVGQRLHGMGLGDRQGSADGQVAHQASPAATRVGLADGAVTGRGGHRSVVLAEDAKAHGGRLRGSS